MVCSFQFVPEYINVEPSFGVKVDLPLARRSRHRRRTLRIAQRFHDLSHSLASLIVRGEVDVAVLLTPLRGPAQSACEFIFVNAGSLVCDAPQQSQGDLRM